MKILVVVFIMEVFQMEQNVFFLLSGKGKNIILAQLSITAEIAGALLLLNGKANGENATVKQNALIKKAGTITLGFSVNTMKKTDVIQL